MIEMSPDSPSTDEASLSIIVPAYNEADNIEASLREILIGAKAFHGPYEVIVVNDCSADRTREIALEFATRHPQVLVVDNPVNLGFGGAFMTGIRHAAMKYSVMVCGDNCTDGDQLAQLFSRVGTSDLIIPHYINIHEGSTLRKLISRIYVSVINRICGLKLKYFNGTNVYPTSRLKDLTITHGYAYAAEILVKLLRSGLSFQEIALKTKPRTEGRSKAFAIRNILSVLKTLILLFLRENRWVRSHGGKARAGKPDRDLPVNKSAA